ncbi:probable serine/threonine-protein kinase PIX13 [Oryza sativa Japonica Group]|uniref:probable serine/threonine-protein kinase PIX13 n=1 Tax=Oryza sativa subsp. japonica TaxID=39947 RepID=UPI00339D2DC2
MAEGRNNKVADGGGFGMVLLEMLTGMRALDTGRPALQHSLVEWAKPYLADRRKLAWLVDPRLEGQYPSRAAQQAAQLTLRCLSGDPRSRPSMAEVVAQRPPIMLLDGFSTWTLILSTAVENVRGKKEEVEDTMKNSKRD